MTSPPRRDRLLIALLLIASGAIPLAFSFEFVGDLLSLSPVLDAQENLVWAAKLASGEIPAEPFYRALFYPWLLSWFFFTGDLLPVVASFIGVVLHLLNAALVARLAFSVWQSRRAAYGSGILYAIYPVSYYYAVQILDVTLGMTCFLAAIVAFTEAQKRSGRLALAWYLASGLLIGLAVLARPHFLPPALLFPLLPFLVFSRETNSTPFTQRIMGALCLALSVMAVLFAQGVANQHTAGEFRVMPWQGAYNLYAANAGNANGRYFTQTVSFDDIPAGMNPTRLESEYRFREAFGAAPDTPVEIDAMNAYWRSELRQHIREDPFEWTGLMGRKIFYLINDFEQYNNLSYEYQKTRFSFLRWNPLGWGLILVGAFAGLYLAWPRIDRQTAAQCTLLALAYAAGVLLFFVSARFRLPLAPLLCVCAGGLAFTSLRQLKGYSPRCLAIGLSGVVILAILSYGNWFGAHDRSTFQQDKFLLASAASRAGLDFEALLYSDEVLAEAPSRQDALRVNTASLYNVIVFQSDGAPTLAMWQELDRRLDRLHSPDPANQFIRGVTHWQLKDQAAAITAWRQAVKEFSPTESLSSARALQAAGAESFGLPEDHPEMQILRQLLN